MFFLIFLLLFARGGASPDIGMRWRVPYREADRPIAQRGGNTRQPYPPFPPFNNVSTPEVYRNRAKKDMRNFVLGSDDTFRDYNGPWRRNQRPWDKRNRYPNKNICVRCPGNYTVIAKKGRSTVVMETPTIKSCNSRKNGYGLNSQVVFGPEPGSPVGEGNHQVVIMVTHRGQVRMCHFQYNVIVKKCPRLNVGEGVRASCTAGDSWGSQCFFDCENPRSRLLGHRRSDCDHRLVWTNPPPRCARKFGGGCAAPLSPENGYLACRSLPEKVAKTRHPIPEGTVCHFRCHPGFRIPNTQQTSAAIRCSSGNWNVTRDPTCVLKGRIISNSLYDNEIKPNVDA